MFCLLLFFGFLKIVLSKIIWLQLNKKNCQKDQKLHKKALFGPRAKKPLTKAEAILRERRKDCDELGRSMKRREACGEKKGI